MLYEQRKHRNLPCKHMKYKSNNARQQLPNIAQQLTDTAGLLITKCRHSWNTWIGIPISQFADLISLMRSCHQWLCFQNWIKHFWDTLILCTMILCNENKYFFGGRVWYIGQNESTRCDHRHCPQNLDECVTDESFAAWCDSVDIRVVGQDG